MFYNTAVDKQLVDKKTDMNVISFLGKEMTHLSASMSCQIVSSTHLTIHKCYSAEQMIVNTAPATAQQNLSNK